MLATLLSVLATTVSPVMLVAADDSGGSTWLLLLGPAGAGAAYFGLWRYYRNTDKSHSFERETRIEARSITENDAKIDEIKGTQKKWTDGHNEADHRKRVQRLD